MKTKCILSPAEFVTMLTVVTLAGHVMYFYMVPHVGWLLACVVTVTALPKTFLGFPHLVSHFPIYTQTYHFNVNMTNLDVFATGTRNIS